MELDDCAFPLLAEVVCTDDADVAFGDADVALLVGAMPRKAGMERSDLLSANGGIFKPQGQALGKSAEEGRQDPRRRQPGQHQRADRLLERRGPRPGPVHGDDPPRPQPRRDASWRRRSASRCRRSSKVTIWGNHSTTQYPDIKHADGQRQERVRARRTTRRGSPTRSSRRSPSAARRSSRPAARRRRRRPPTPRSTTSARGRSAPPRATGRRSPSSATAATACPRASSPASR